MGMQLVILAINTLSTTYIPEVMNVNAISTLSPFPHEKYLYFFQFHIFLSSGCAAYDQSFIHLTLAWPGNKWSS